MPHIEVQIHLGFEVYFETLASDNDFTIEKIKE